MKTKILLLAALLGAAAMSANAGLSFGVSIGLPAVVSTPVVYAPTPAPMTVVQTVPPCPDVNYVWAPGYWSYRPTGWVWMSGGWHPRPMYFGRGYDRGYDRDRDHGHDRGGYRH